MKLFFPMDAYVNGELIYEKGKTYEVKTEGGSAARWVVRGAIEVREEPKPQENNDKVAETVEAKPDIIGDKPKHKKHKK